MLQTLNLSFNKGIGDDGLVALARGLVAAPRTRLTNPDLKDVGMGDAGMAALARAVGAKSYERLVTISFGHNKAVTDEGVCMLAQAIEDTGKHGLPQLVTLHASSHC